MKLKTYRYGGPPSSASLNVDGETLDVILSPEKRVQLPPEHEYTLVMIAQQWLQEVEGEGRDKEAPAAESPATPPAAAPAASAAPQSDEPKEKTRGR